MAVMDQYLWIAVVGTACGFVYAFGIGANDVANAFASTVSSKSLTLKQAVIVAGIFEFLGAILLGASVTSTIRSKIFDIALYEDEPEIVLLGMMTSILASTLLLLGATFFGLPVSTTHTVVGAIMGFSICAKGFPSINWDVAIQIFISWVISPAVAGVIALAFFVPLRLFVLRHDNAYQRAYLTFPIVLLIGVGIDLFYVLYKAGSNFNADEALPLNVVLPASFGFGAVCGLLWLKPVGPFTMKRINARLDGTGKNNSTVHEVNEEDKPESAPETVPSVNIEHTRDLGEDEEEACDFDEEEDKKVNFDEEEGGVTAGIPLRATPDQEDSEEGDDDEQAGEPKTTKRKSLLHQMSSKFVENTYGQDLHSQSMHENPEAASIWDAGEVFDPHAEQLFTYVQVFTACLNSFAHGANDVSNAIAPISAIIAIYQTGELSSKAPVQKWILAYGGVGIVLGLLLYGYKVMKSLGFKVTILSPSRGACAELAASLFVVTASFLGIPVSSTQCIVGAVAGVGVAGGRKNVQWLFLLRVCVGWVGVFFAAVIVSAGIFSFVAFSPSLATPV
jgi:sodium-dependent phosphate transporter